MPYIGRGSDFGVRSVFHFLASNGDTSVSGADADGKNLSFADGNFIDVYLNGVRLKSGEDYNTATANTVAGLSALNANDEVNVVVYDTFAVADTVKASEGGTFSGDVTTTGTFNVTGDTAAGDDASIGHTSAEGLILTGQGTTNDVTIKNDADTAVVQIPTGTDDVNFTDDVTLKSDGAILGFGADTDINLTHVADTGLTTNGTFTAANSMLINGTTPTLTIGDAGAEDTKIVFDGNAQDFHIGLDDSADDLVIGLGSTLGTTTHMAFDETGNVRKPLQSAFQASKSAAQNNVSNDDVVAFGEEIFDVNGDFASNVFTAPVTGKYQLSFSIRIDNILDDAYYYGMSLVTSNRSYQHIYQIPQGDGGLSQSFHSMQYAVVADMDANDTAQVVFNQSDGTASSAHADLTDDNMRTNFHGYFLG